MYYLCNKHGGKILCSPEGSHFPSENKEDLDEKKNNDSYFYHGGGGLHGNFTGNCAGGGKSDEQGRDQGTDQ